MAQTQYWWNGHSFSLSMHKIQYSKTFVHHAYVCIIVSPLCSSQCILHTLYKNLYRLWTKTMLNSIGQCLTIVGDSLNWLFCINWPKEIQSAHAHTVRVTASKWFNQIMYKFTLSLALSLSLCMLHFAMVYSRWYYFFIVYFAFGKWVYVEVFVLYLIFCPWLHTIESFR